MQQYAMLGVVQQRQRILEEVQQLEVISRRSRKRVAELTVPLSLGLGAGLALPRSLRPTAFVLSGQPSS